MAELVKGVNCDWNESDFRGAGKPSFDERRGMHLLSTGDLVRFGASFWDVTGVELHTALDCDVVTLRRVGNAYPGEPESRVPLKMIERGDVYLRAIQSKPT